MNTVWEGLGLHTLFYLSDHLGYRAVCQQHELFNELGGIVRFLEVATRGMAILIDVEMQLLTVELHCTVLETAFAQLLGHFVQDTQFFGIITVFAF